MSLLFVEAWISRKRKGTEDVGTERCECDPMWSCRSAIMEHFKIIEFPDYEIPHTWSLRHRNVNDCLYYHYQETELESVNNRVRIYK